jgi:hypothetical protein
MRTLLLILLLILTFSSCTENNQNDGKKTEAVPKTVEFVQIQFLPCFIASSIISIDFQNRKIVFQRIGEKNQFLRPVVKQEIKKLFVPKSYYLSLDTSLYNSLNKLILNKFSNDDFKDGITDEYADGALTVVFISFSDGKFQDFEFNSKVTLNQNNLIVNLLNYCINHGSDSLTNKYLMDLKGYYN